MTSPAPSVAPRPAIALVGLLAAAVQVVLLREYLSIAGGNELIIGAALCCWMLAGSLGSLVGGRVGRGRADIGAVAAAAAAATGFVCIRAVRLPFAPGETVPAAVMLCAMALSSAPVSSLAGYLFAVLGRQSGTALYGAENGGNAAGALIVYVAALLYAPNGVILALAIFPLAFLLLSRRVLWFTVLALAASAPILDSATDSWKYPGGLTRVVNGREGELAWVVSSGDTTVMLNGQPYRSTVGQATVEQSVHLPMGVRGDTRRVLVVYDQGVGTELSRYDDIDVTRIGLDRALAGPDDLHVPVEKHRSVVPYDVILLGVGMPSTAAESRCFTDAFYHRMHGLLSHSGVLSFTLPFSENYLNDHEERLFHMVFKTLLSVFPHVRVFPGAGYTFMASPSPLPDSVRLVVGTDYLEQFVLPSVSPDRVETANRAPPEGTPLSTRGRPVALYLELQRWAREFRVPLHVLAVFGAGLVLLVALLLPRTRAVLSIGSSGLAAGAVSMGYLFLHQTTHGALYSQVSLLLIALSAGFVMGSQAVDHLAGPRLRTVLRHSMDGTLAAYAVVSLVLLSLPVVFPVWVFVCAQTLLGGLCAVQFRIEGDTEGHRYAADLLGGVVGMLLASLVVVPLFGVVSMAVGVGALKAAAWAIRVHPGRS